PHASAAQGVQRGGGLRGFDIAGVGGAKTPAGKLVGGSLGERQRDGDGLGIGFELGWRGGVAEVALENDGMLTCGFSQGAACQWRLPAPDQVACTQEAAGRE